MEDHPLKFQTLAIFILDLIRMQIFADTRMPARLALRARMVGR
jgi:hypothetical protein